jgi:hypothetical protein
MAEPDQGCSEHRALADLSRRQALQVGALAGLGVTLPGMLRREALAGPTTTVKAKSVILLWLQGGVSHHETFDPKPFASEEIRGEFHTIATNLPGERIGQHLPKLSQMMDRLAVIRSVTHKESAHQRGSMYMVAGRRPGRNVSNEDMNDNPDLGSIIAHQLGMRGGLPAYVSIPGNDFTSKFTGNGWLPASSAPFKGVHSSSLAAPDGFNGQRLDDRVALREALESDTSRSISNQRGGVAYDQFDDQAVDIIASAAASKAFDYLSERDATLDLYGVGNPRKGGKPRRQMPDLCLTARRLVEAGVRYVTIGRNSWDHHSNIFPQIKSRVPRFDQAFAGLVTDLEDRGMLDETLVVYMTEFGRTPKVNSQKGRDHWPRVFSVAFAGAGIKTGQILGASDKDGAEPADMPITPEQIAATILSLTGVHPQTEVTQQDDRPIAYVDRAAPITALLA